MTPLEDPEEAQQLKRQARRVYREAISIAVLVMGIVMLARGLMGT